MNIQFSENYDPYKYKYISCFFNLKNEYVFVSKKVCYSSFCSMDQNKCRRVWEILDFNNSILRAIVRNPYSRLESMYKDKLLYNVNKENIQTNQIEIIKIFGESMFFDLKISFADFVFAIPNLIYNECHFFPQSMFIPKFIDNIHKMENKSELDCVFSLFNRNNVICNKTPDLKLEWTYEMRNIINNLYYEDFIRFNYIFI